MFADSFDAASHLEELERQRIIAAHQNRTSEEAPDEDADGRYFLDCGDVIPPARVLAVNAVRCVVCATRREARR